jgi:outer membrane protein assembly factor BamB
MDPAGRACSSAWEGGCEIPGISGDLRASPLVDASGNIYLGTKDNESSMFYKIDGSCPTTPASRVIWEVETHGDVYTTGVLLDNGHVVFGQEPGGSGAALKALNMSDGSLEGYVDLTADMTWGSLRMHEGRLIGVADVAPQHWSGFMFSINLGGVRYEPGAENPTLRGENSGRGY